MIKEETMSQNKHTAFNQSGAGPNLRTQSKRDDDRRGAACRLFRSTLSWRTVQLATDRRRFAHIRLWNRPEPYTRPLNG